MSSRIRKAVFPSAGWGTRFLPVTKAVPKEMIPLVDTPMIQFTIEEAVNSGIEQIVLVTSRHKTAIENYFDRHVELEALLEASGKLHLLDSIRSLQSRCEFVSVRQSEMKGLGHAVWTAKKTIGDEPFAVLLGDDLIFGSPPCTAQLMKVFDERGTSGVGVMEVPREETSKYGIVDVAAEAGRTHSVRGMVEKPAPKDAPSLFAVPGRYVLTPEIFSILESTAPGRGGEVQLTDALAVLAKNKKLWAHQFEGRRFDTGDRLGYLEATIHVALGRPELQKPVRAMLERVLQGPEAL
jgi:UTP--glucose-1-phosphate uridylyltransferase